MKKYILIYTLFLMSTYAVAQENPIGKNQEIGINTSSLLSQLLGDSNQNAPYALTYKLIRNDKALRLGIGGFMNRSVSKEEGFADTESTTNYGVDLRVGYEWQKKIGERWTGYLGADIVVANHADKLVNDSGFDKVTELTQTMTLGFGPVAGIQFHINDRLSLLTESALYGKYNQIKSARLFKNFPEFDDELDNSNGQQVDFVLPSNIYLVFNF